MAPLVRRTWAPRGETPILLQRGRSHRKVSAIAAIVVSPRARRVNLYFRLHRDISIDARLVRSFLKHLSVQIPGRFVVVWDRLNTHRAKIVARWMVSKRRVSQEFFPPYVPELNPVEYVWGHVKTGPMANMPKIEVADLARSANLYTRAVSRNQPLLKAFLRHSSLFSSK